MLVRELINLLNNYGDLDNEVTLYDLATGNRHSISLGDIDTGVAGLFEINYDSSQDYDEDYMNTNPNT